jgi:hypothetical protein
MIDEYKPGSSPNIPRYESKAISRKNPTLRPPYSTPMIKGICLKSKKNPGDGEKGNVIHKMMESPEMTPIKNSFDILFIFPSMYLW